MDQIKQIRIYPPEKGTSRIIVVYEIPDPEILPDKGHYLAIDLGLHNLMTCYDSGNGKDFYPGGENILRWRDIFIRRLPGYSLYGMDSSQQKG